MDEYRIVQEKTKYYNYAFESPYSIENVNFCRELKMTYGWQEFSYNDGRWRFKNPALIQVIRERFPSLKIDSGIIVEVNEKVEKEVRVEELKRSTDSSLLINGIKGKLYPYQKVGVEFFMNSGGKAMLCDEPGVGKTAQVLAYLAHTGKKRTLVVCPASVKFSWEMEVKKWTKLKSQIIDGKTNMASIEHDTNVVIVNYDVLKRLFNQLMLIEWDCLVGDESHLIKNNTAQRTKAFKAIAKKVKSLILLTGTPVLSRPAELWNALTLMDPKTWVNYWDFTRRYCDGHQSRWGWEAKGATNLEELQEKISRYFLRRRKEDVLKDLPKKVFIDFPVDMDDKTFKEYNTAEKEFSKYLRDYKNKKPWEITKVMGGEKLAKINALRQIAVWGKINSAKELVQSIIDSGQKVLVFSSFNAPLEFLKMEFPDAVMITGKTPVKDRGEIIKQFQGDPDTNIFLGGTTAAGVGITLTAASYVIFLDYSWNPADMEQALNRAHRPGATAERLTIYQMFSKGSIDEFMRKLLSGKQEIFDKLLGEYEEEVPTMFLEDFEDELLAKFNYKIKKKK